MSYLLIVNMTLFANVGNIKTMLALGIGHSNIEHIDAKCHVVTLIVKLVTLV